MLGTFILQLILSGKHLFPFLFSLWLCLCACLSLSACFFLSNDFLVASTPPCYPKRTMMSWSFWAHGDTWIQPITVWKLWRACPRYIMRCFTCFLLGLPDLYNPKTKLLWHLFFRVSTYLGGDLLVPNSPPHQGRYSSIHVFVDPESIRSWPWPSLSLCVPVLFLIHRNVHFLKNFLLL